jgi:hypothetical protein
MFVKQIAEVKGHLDQLKDNGSIERWELPYENLLTRLNAAILFLTPAGQYEADPSAIWNELEKYEHFSFRLNREKKLSSLAYRVTFSEEEKAKNLIVVSGDAAAGLQ